MLCVGCDAQSPNAGEEGGACQVGPTQCDEGLTCVSGTCQISEEMPAPPDLEVTFFLEVSELPADGQSALVFEVMVTEGEDQDPYEGEIFVYPDPVMAGEVTPRPLELDEGFGLGTYTACERGKDIECPEYVRLIVTTENDPLLPFAASAYFRLLGDPSMETSGGGESTPREQTNASDGSPESSASSTPEASGSDNTGSADETDEAQSEMNEASDDTSDADGGEMAANTVAGEDGNQGPPASGGSGGSDR